MSGYEHSLSTEVEKTGSDWGGRGYFSRISLWHGVAHSRQPWEFTAGI